MLEKLTEEQEALIPVVVEEYLQLLQPPTPFDNDAVEKWLARVYKMYDLALPKRIEIADSPQAALRLASELLGSKQTSLDWMGISDAGWVSFYDYWHRIGVLTDEESVEILELREFMKSAWDTVLLDEAAIVVRRPELISVDAEGNLHCADGPCIRWRDGVVDYSWHNVWVTEKVIMTPQLITRDEYLAMSTEVRRAVGERAGWAFVVELLGAKLVDEWTDPHTGLAYGLFRSERDQWLRKQSPVLQNSSQPVYFEPVHEDLRTAQAARKWQAVPEQTTAECEADPVLVYGQEA